VDAGVCDITIALSVYAPWCPYFWTESATDKVHVTAVSVKIKQDGNDITDTTHNEIVGKQINLTGEVLPQGLTVDSHEWTIPGIRIEDYIANNDYGQVVELTGLDEPSVSYYWVDGGDGRQVQYTVSVLGTACSAEATFDVKRPTATMSTSTSSVDINEGSGEYYYGLRFGDPTTTPVTPGIEFNCAADIPDGFEGTTELVQLYTYNRTRERPGKSQALEATGLDNVFPYGLGTSDDDMPDQGLETDWDKVTVNDSATMWFIFKPSGAGAIWVPLRKVDWSWEGTAHRVQGNEWTLDTADNSENPSSVDTTEHPQWIHNIEDDEWE